VGEGLQGQQLSTVKILYELALGHIKQLYSFEDAQEEFEAINELVKRSFPNQWDEICHIKLW
jgi:hypothetical protein